VCVRCVYTGMFFGVCAFLLGKIPYPPCRKIAVLLLALRGAGCCVCALPLVPSYYLTFHGSILRLDLGFAVFHLWRASSIMFPFLPGTNFLRGRSSVFFITCTLSWYRTSL
jgi:hypothetical protein